MACGVRGRLRARARPRRLRGRRVQQQLEQRKQQQRNRKRWGRPFELKSPAKSPAPARPRRKRPRKPGSPNSRTPTAAPRISYDGVGSGGGREKFISGGVAFAGSDTPLSESEGELAKAVKRCAPGELVEVPDYISPIAIIYNLPGVEELKLDPETLAKIFNQEIENWNDPEIAKENPEVELPETRIVPVNRSDESGTTENFTDYLSKVAPSVWTHEVSGEWPVKGGEAASGTSGVVEAVSAGEGAIGYADASQAGELGKAMIKVGSDLGRTVAGSRRQSPRSLERRSGTGERQQKRHRVRNRPEDRSERRLPDHPGLLADRLHQIQVGRRSGPGQRLTSNTRSARKGRRWPKNRPAPRRSRTTLTKKVEAAVGAIE